MEGQKKRYGSLKKRFTDKQWEVLELVNPYGQDMTFTEAAKELGISVAAVRDRLLNAEKVCPKMFDSLIFIKQQLNRDCRALTLFKFQQIPLDETKIVQKF